MGDFNSQTTDSIMKDFMEANGFINLIKIVLMQIWKSVSILVFIWE